MQINTIQYTATMQCNAMQISAIQCNAMQCNSRQYNTLQQCIRRDIHWRTIFQISADDMESLLCEIHTVCRFVFVTLYYQQWISTVHWSESSIQYSALWNKMHNPEVLSTYSAFQMTPCWLGFDICICICKIQCIIQYCIVCSAVLYKMSGLLWADWALIFVFVFVFVVVVVFVFKFVFVFDDLGSHSTRLGISARNARNFWTGPKKA